MAVRPASRLAARIKRRPNIGASSVSFLPRYHSSMGNNGVGSDDVSSEAQASPITIVAALARQVRDLGGRALIVGGWVRDRLLGHESKDIDLEVFGLPVDRLRSLLEQAGRVEAVGESFQVFKIADLDVALPRRESKIGRGHRGFTVAGDPEMTVEEAARRRDFTINAISGDPLGPEDAYVDPFGGRGDLEARVLRVVDPATFGDDSLRVLRGVQFAARFDLTMDEGTRALCRAVPLDDLPAERIWGEIEKLLRALRPS